MPKPAYLVVDIETIPDGDLLARTRYPGERLTPAEAVKRAREEARTASATGSDFLPLTWQVPIALCVGRVGPDFRLQDLRCLDSPHFRPREITRAFWRGLDLYRARLVTFNGRCFDLPVLELAAFRWAIPVPHHFLDRSNSRNRYGDGHLDLMDFLSNFGAYRFVGGLNLLAKMLHKPGKMAVHGADVYDLYLDGRLQHINDYCMFDVLDTYFVFLRTRVLTGDLTPEEEQSVVKETKTWLTGRLGELPHLRQYLDHWQAAERAAGSF